MNRISDAQGRQWQHFKPGQLTYEVLAPHVDNGYALGEAQDLLRLYAEF